MSSMMPSSDSVRTSRSRSEPSSAADLKKDAANTTTSSRLELPDGPQLFQHSSSASLSQEPSSPLPHASSPDYTPAGMGTLGNSFSIARDIVLQCLESTILEYKNNLKSDNSKFRDKWSLVSIYVVPIVFFIVIVAVSTSLSLSDRFHAGHWTVVAIVAFLCVINSIVMLRLYDSHTFELSQRLTNIMADYKVALRSFSSDSSSNVTNCGIVLGNPHVSIVSCWRNEMWQRIPSLLLADGDVIALMGGDATPGNVQVFIGIIYESLHD
jgi:hypothetical protein